MNTYDIWEEGFCVMEGSATAHLIATGVPGENFLDACKKHLKNDSLFRVDNNGTPSRWGCRLFDNEIDARKSFG